MFFFRREIISASYWSPVAYWTFQSIQPPPLCAETYIISRTRTLFYINVYIILYKNVYNIKIETLFAFQRVRPTNSSVTELDVSPRRKSVTISSSVWTRPTNEIVHGLRLRVSRFRKNRRYNIDRSVNFCFSERHVFRDAIRFYNRFVGPRLCVQIKQYPYNCNKTASNCKTNGFQQAVCKSLSASLPTYVIIGNKLQLSLCVLWLIIRNTYKRAPLIRARKTIEKCLRFLENFDFWVYRTPKKMCAVMHEAARERFFKGKHPRNPAGAAVYFYNGRLLCFLSTETITNLFLFPKTFSNNCITIELFRYFGKKFVRSVKSIVRYERPTPIVSKKGCSTLVKYKITFPSLLL